MSTKVFLSYSHRDKASAEKVSDALTKASLDIFVDWNDLRSGDRWLDKLQDALKSCGSFVVLVGEEGVQRWVGAEVNAALERHFGPREDKDRLPIHPLLLPGADMEQVPPFLRHFQADAWQPGEALPKALLDALTVAAARAGPPAVRIEGNPYVGLAAFQRDQADRYFGRRMDVLRALASLGDQLQRGPASLPATSGSGYWRWLQIVGDSGSGKSSLVRAGMLPLIESGALWPRTNLATWRILGPLSPGKWPTERLARALEELNHPDGEGLQTDERKRRLLSYPRSLAMDLGDLRGRAKAGMLLVIDQLEELITLADEAERLAFDQRLAEALEDADSGLFVISTVRSDFGHRLPRLLPRLFETVFQDRYCKWFPLSPMGASGLREVIEGPARLGGVDVSSVVDSIVREAEGEPSALPLI